MTLNDQLAALEGYGLVRPAMQQQELEYMFRHALVQEAAYSSLLKNTRHALHQAVGESLERLYPERIDELAPMLAHHYAEGGDDRKAMHFSTRAAEFASQKYANLEAVAHYTLALEAAHRLGEPSAGLRHARGHGHELLGGFDAARADYEAALEEARAHGRREAEWQSLMDLGFLWAARDYAQTGAYLERAYELASGMNDSLTIARSLNRVGNWYLNVDRALESLRYHERALDIFQTLGDRAGTAETLDLLAMANFQSGDVIRSAEQNMRASELFRELGAREALASAMSVRSIMGAVSLDQATVSAGITLPDCIRVGRDAIALAREIGWRVGESFALICLGQNLSAEGSFGLAYGALRDSLAIAEAVGHQQWMVAAYWGLGLLYYDLLAHPAAERHAVAGYELARATGTILFEFETAALLASLALESNDLPRAEYLLDRSTGRPSAGSIPCTSSNLAAQRVVRMVRTELVLARGQGEAALSMTDDLLAATAHIEEYGHRAIPRLARLRAEALTLLGRYAEAEAELHAALAGARSLGARPYQWRIQRTLAALYRAQGRHVEQAQAATAARALAADLAATISDDLANSIDGLNLRDNFLHRAELMTG